MRFRGSHVLVRMLALLLPAVVVVASITLWPTSGSAQAPAQVLYGSIGTYLVEIDTGTGVASAIGQHSAIMTEMAYSEVDGVLYAIDFDGSRFGLVAIDLTTTTFARVGSLRPRGSSTPIANVTAFAYNAIDKSLYAALGPGRQTNQIVRVDPLTAEYDFVTSVHGTIENEADGMEFVNGIPYIVDIGLPAILYTMSLSTGAASPVGIITGATASNAGAARDMAFDPSTNTTYAPGWTQGSPIADRLLTLSLTTAVGTLVGVTHSAPQFDSGSLRGLAIGPARNSAPTADAGLDQTVECAGVNGTPVTLNGLLSSDPDSDPLTFTWTGPFPESDGTVTGGLPTVTLPNGTHTITLTVMDSVGQMATDQVVITVADSTAPTVTAALTPLGNNDDDDRRAKDEDDDSGKDNEDESGDQEHQFRVVAQASDSCDPLPTVVAEINGYPVLDGQIVVIKLNNGKERVRVKHGLVEFKTARATLTVTATDASGNSSTQQVVLEKSKDDDDDHSDD